MGRPMLARNVAVEAAMDAIVLLGQARKSTLWALKAMSDAEEALRKFDGKVEGIESPREG